MLKKILIDYLLNFSLPYEKAEKHLENKFILFQNLLDFIKYIKILIIYNKTLNSIT
jgi:hypothetical protein